MGSHRRIDAAFRRDKRNPDRKRRQSVPHIQRRRCPRIGIDGVHPAAQICRCGDRNIIGIVTVRISQPVSLRRLKQQTPKKHRPEQQNRSSLTAFYFPPHFLPPENALFPFAAFQPQ